MVIKTNQITDGKKKNELIIYARSINCEAVYSEENEGMVILCCNRKTAKLIRAKIKELEKDDFSSHI